MFVHLHNHTEYSLGDGTINFGTKERSDAFIAHLDALKFDCFAITDHGNLFGAGQFTHVMESAGKKPIIGCEVYITTDRHIHDKDEKYYHLTLLVKNKTGWKNLIYLVSESYRSGFYYKPRIDHALLREHADGLVCLSGCMNGEIASALRMGNYPTAKKTALLYKDMFGENFYLEAQNHGIQGDVEIIAGLERLSVEIEVPVVATNDCHYLNEQAFLGAEALRCVRDKMKMSDPSELRKGFGSNVFYVRSEEEMLQLFPDHPEWVYETVAVADKCQFRMSELKGEMFFPTFPVPEGTTIDAYLRDLTYEGLVKKYSEVTEEVKERVEYELGVIVKQKYSGYFLIVADVIQWAKKHEIPIGPGRGSAGGSIVAYALDITDLDPLQYNLMFERFLNPDRIGQPDIDIDVSDLERGRIIEYVRERWGTDRVAQILTYNTLQSSSSIKDMLRVFGAPPSYGDKITKAFPPEAKNIKDACTNERFIRFQELLEEIDAEIKERDPHMLSMTLHGEPTRYRSLIDVLKVASNIEGIKRNLSIHAAGVIIAPQPLDTIVPLFYKVDDKETLIAVQMDKDVAEAYGLLKIDFLGLKNLSIIDTTVKSIKRNHGVEVSVASRDIPMNDPKTMELFCNNPGSPGTYGVFQFESRGMVEYLQKLQPKTIEDLIAMNALYRPGPIKNIPKYIARKNNQEPVDYYFPQCAVVLQPTHGVLTYQEQVMNIAILIGGFTRGESDELRKAMAKKKRDYLMVSREKFLNRAHENGLSSIDVTRLWTDMEKFGEYGFNRAHSACYSFVAYQTGYLKAHYPAEYMAALMTTEMGDITRTASSIRECKNLGITVVPPNVNKSGVFFEAKNNVIIFALAGVKGVGVGVSTEIVNERSRNGAFASLFDFVNRVRPDEKTFSALARVGAFDVFGVTRASVVLNTPVYLSINKTKKPTEQVASLFDDEELSDMESESFEKNLLPQQEFDKMAIYRYEIDGLGASLTSDLLADYNHLRPDNVDEIMTVKSDYSHYASRKVRFFGFLESFDALTSKRGEVYYKGVFLDNSGPVDVIVFKNQFQKIDRTAFSPGNVGIMEGFVDEREFNNEYTYSMKPSSFSLV